MLLSLGGTNRCTNGECYEKKDGKWICLSRSQVQREIKTRIVRGWHKGGVAGHITQSMCQERH